MHATLTNLSEHAVSEKSTPRISRFILPIALILVVLAVEAGWVALLGYGVVFLLS
jgi:hypothetical protein